MVAARKLSTEITFSPTEPQLIASQPSLKKLLTTLNRFADHKSTMPLLGAIRIATSCKVTCGEAHFTATDLNLWIEMTTEDWGRGNGVLVVKGKPLAATVAKIGKGDEITLCRDHGKLDTTVIAGSASLRVEGFHGQDFPAMPRPANETTFATIDAGALVSLFKRTDNAVCKDETRFHLNGTFIEADGKTVRAVTTDGHRLVRVTSPLKGWTLPTGVIVPRKTCVELAKLLKAGECEIAVGKSTTGMVMLFVRQANWLVASKLIDAQFPPYEQVIPTEHRKLVTVDRVALIAAMERAKVICTETRGVKLSCADDQLKISADNGDGQDVTEWMPAEHRGGSSVVGFNPQYVIDALAHLDGERVTIALGNELDPGLIRDTDDVVTNALDESPYLVVVMPMRI